MSFELQHIKSRIATTRQIKKVTTAMQQVASAKMLAHRRAMQHVTLYLERLGAVLNEVMCELDSTVHPLLAPRADENHYAMVVFGSDRGLCGGYNAILSARLEAFAAERPGRDMQLITIGRRLAQRVRRRGFTVRHAFSQPAPTQRAAGIDALRGLLEGLFTGPKMDAVYLLYTRFYSAVRLEPVAEKLLPFELKAGRRWSAHGFEPKAEQLLDRLLPEYMRQALDNAFLNSLAAENASRQSAMLRASENASDVLDELTTRYRQLRQEGITAEMLELIGGGAQFA